MLPKAGHHGPVDHANDHRHMGSVDENVHRFEQRGPPVRPNMGTMALPRFVLPGLGRGALRCVAPNVALKGCNARR